MRKKIVIICLLICASFNIWANKIKIPADYSKIQYGIDHAVNGDTVLVSPGTYYENINFKGKNIMVVSNYIQSGAVDDIINTIIDGSRAAFADSASCVFFCSSEDSTAVIEGFTITKGKGTRYLYPNGWFREGGGVFVEKSSPTIKNNHIVDNEVLNYRTVTSAGGGAIRSNLGNPHIYNNLITNNKALFGAAIVLDFSDATVKNNIIYQNTGANVYGGGGGFWIYGPGRSVIIENNTIMANSLGGIFFQAIKASVLNNIIWGNDGYQINSSDGLGKTMLTVENNIIQGGFAGNTDLYPIFKEISFFVDPSSPSVDAGLEEIIYNDIEDPSDRGHALLPSLGGLRNDIGAYGGPNATIFPPFEFSNIASKAINFGSNDTIGKPVFRNLVIENQSTKSVNIDSIKRSPNCQVIVKSFSGVGLKPLQSLALSLEWTPQNNLKYIDTLMIYHRISNVANPLKVSMTGRATKTTSTNEITSISYLNIIPNPFKESAIIQYKGVMPDSKIDIFDLNGKMIRSVKIDNTEGSVTFRQEGMSPGIYLYKLKSDNSVLNGKFVIKSN